MYGTNPENSYMIQEIEPHHYVVYLIGKIGIGRKELEELRDIFDTLSERAYANLTVNFKEVDFITSNGISLILRTFKRIKNREGNFRIINMNPRVYSTFELLGLTDVMEIHQEGYENLEKIYDQGITDSSNIKKFCKICRKILDSSHAVCPYCKMNLE